MIYLLLLTLAIPAAAAVLLMVLRRSMSGRTPRWIALVATVAALLVSLGLASEFRALPLPETAPNSAVQSVSVFPIQPRFLASYHWFTYSRRRGGGGRRPRVSSSTFTSASTALAWR